VGACRVLVGRVPCPYLDGLPGWVGCGVRAFEARRSFGIACYFFTEVVVGVALYMKHATVREVVHVAASVGMR
jgi:hypothetical protein